MGDSETYWATIAQIVPVLFIAVMIEFRWTFARLARTNETFESSRGYRLITGIVLFVVSVGLCFVFIYAIEALRNNKPSEGPGGLVASHVFALSAGLGLGGPGVALAYSATQDFWTWLHRSMPWSKVRRLTRRIASEEDRLREQDAEIRHLLLLRRMEVASAYVNASVRDLATRELPEPARSAGMRSVAKLYVFADEFKEDLDRLVATRPEEYTGSETSDFVEGEQEIFRNRLSDVSNRSSS